MTTPEVDRRSPKRCFRDDQIAAEAPRRRPLDDPLDEDSRKSLDPRSDPNGARIAHKVSICKQLMTTGY